MRSHFILLVFLAGCARSAVQVAAPAAPGSSTRSEPAPTHRFAVDELAGACMQSEHVKSLAIGLLSRDQTEVYGYGHATDTSDAPSPTGETIFEIGSVTKVFTAVLLAEMAERRLAAIDEPVRELLPGGVNVEGEAASQVRLVHLATHTSGLPRLPDNLRPKDEKNPYCDYGKDELYAFLSARRLEQRPGAEFEYSNVGAGLLGHLLSLRAGRRYESLVLDWIAGPLGMTHTAIELAPSAQAMFAAGHDADGNPVPPWDLGVLEGTGGLRSTVNDMVRFIRANIELSNLSVSPALEVTQTTRFVRPGGRVALGWMVGLPSPALRAVRWHNGRTGGYASFVGFDRLRKTGVVVLANSSIPIDHLGTDLLRLLLDA
jgi:serine-type D-Ala-D-Ala carboxypeptidase/endopeptidase